MTDDTQNPRGTDLTPTLPHNQTPFAADSMAAIAQQFAKELTASDMLDVLQSSLRGDREGAGMMFAQSRVLDMLFHRLTLKAMSGVDDKGDPIKNYVEQETLHLALRAQKQCRTTVEALVMARNRQDEVDKRAREKNDERTRNGDYGW